jgi:predicted esterase
LSLASELGVADVAFLAPQAAGSTWYPYSFLAPVDRNEPWLSSALAKVGAVVERSQAAGIPPERTVLLGFSQGACLAVEYAARNARRYGGVAVLSGGLIGAVLKPERYRGDFEGTSVFLGCSDIDPHIPVERVRDSAAQLERMGAAVTMRLYPGMGHAVNAEELDRVRAMLVRAGG